MSVNVTTAFVQAYSSNVMQLVQQKGSMLRQHVRREKVSGKSGFFDQIGSTAARRRTTRHGDTPRMDTPHARRRVTLEDFDWADLIDKEDKVRLLKDPSSDYAQAAAWAMGRSMDEVLVDGAFGTAYTGETGGTAVTFPAGQQIGVAASGLTMAKLLAAKELLDGSDVPPERRHIAATAKQFTNLLNATEIKSADYNTVKALVQGQVDEFLGFKFHRLDGVRADGTKILPLDGSGDRRCLAWQMDGLLLAVGAEPAAKISERADKNYATQVFYSMSIGATRMEEKRVVEIVCDE